VEKLRKMARAFFEAQRNTGEVWLFLNSGKPILNYAIKVMFEDVCHTLNFESIAPPFGARYRFYRMDHTSSFIMRQCADRG
jgi:hypothetical protein